MNRITLKAKRGRRRETLEARTRRLRPTVMALEGRALLSTLTVTNTNDSGPGSLRAAIAQANYDGGGDTITFSSLFNTPQTIELTGGQLELSGAALTTIKGPGASLLTVSGGDGVSRVLEVGAGSEAALSGLTITGGSATDFGGGVLNDGGKLTLTDVTLRDNAVSNYQATFGGGGLAAGGTGATTTLIDCSVTGNSAGGSSDNSAFGGGIYNDAYDTLTMTGCTISGNTADGEGGGICNQGISTLTMSDCTISNNSSGTRGGGLFNYGTATLTDVTVSRNSALQNGGGLVNYGGILTLTGCTVSGNSSEEGGGLAATEGGQTALTDCTFSGNFASNNGGGAINADGTLTLANCTLSGNSAGGSGGGLCNGTASPVFAASGATSASGRGVGQYETPTISLTNCTVSGNTAYGGDGGVVNYATLALTNAIVAGNTGGDVSGSYTGSNNLIGGNPLLSALGDFGGPTETMALLPGSPAIGGGTTGGAPGMDQRGQPRSGPVDIGAFQSQGFTITPVGGGDPQSTPINQPFTKPLAFTVTANNPVEPVDGGVVSFAVIPGGGASAMLSATKATIASGMASVTATANSTMGNYVVSATATGAGSDGFVLTNIQPPSLVVTTNLDDMSDTDGLTSLREAIAYADSLGVPCTITFDPAFFGTKRRTIRLTGGPLVLTDPATITIVGPGARRLTISGGGKSGVFDVEGGSLALSGVTIMSGNAELGGGVRNDGGRLVLSSVLIQGNRAIVGGGLFNDGRTTLRGVLIKGNVAHVGRGIFNTRSASLTRRPSPERGVQKLGFPSYLRTARHESHQPKV